MKPPKKITSLLWTYIKEAILFSVIILAIILYYLRYYGYLSYQDDWGRMLLHALILIAIVIGIGLIFGYWQISKIKKKLDQLQDYMLYLLKGNIAHELPDLGEDEIGKLGEQLTSLSKQWEEQVTSLQRLSTNNAKLAEKAKFSAVTEERQRLARELHDSVSQQLFAISMTATAVGRTMDRDFEQAKRQISLIEEMAAVAQSEMRALLLHLRPVHLEGKRLSQGIRELLQELRAKVPMDIHLDIDQEVQLNRGVEDHLFRITQEALANTLRHSKATRTEIRLQHSQHYFLLSIRDNGIGFELDQHKHTSYGLVSMKERVHEIGGRLQIVTAPGKGTRIDIRVPFVKDESAKQDEQIDREGGEEGYE